MTLKNQYIINAGKFGQIVPLEKKYIDAQFVRRINDPGIKKYLNNKKKYSKRNCIQYLNTKSKNKDFYFLLLSPGKNQTRIGTATLTKPKYNKTKFGFMIFNRFYLGSLASRYLFQVLLKFAFKELKVKKILAGTHFNNKAAQHALIYNNFKLIKKNKTYFHFTLTRKAFTNVQRNIKYVSIKF